MRKSQQVAQAKQFEMPVGIARHRTAIEHWQPLHSCLADAVPAGRRYEYAVSRFLQGFAILQGQCICANNQHAGRLRVGDAKRARNRPAGQPLYNHGSDYDREHERHQVFSTLVPHVLQTQREQSRDRGGNDTPWKYPAQVQSLAPVQLASDGACKRTSRAGNELQEH